MSNIKLKKGLNPANLSNDKLVEVITLKKKELISLRFKLKLGELTDTSLFKKAKKSIAKAHTEIAIRSEVK